MKHTPGKWEIMIDLDTPFIGKKYAGGFVAIAHTYSVSGNEKERLANARLIAAAPELLELLKRTLSLFDKGFEKGTIGERYFTEVNQAIAKAEGEKG